MHECPECGQLCDCDQEDLEHEHAPDDCFHVCDDSDDLDEEDLFYDDDEPWF